MLAKLDQYIKKLLPYDKCVHLIIGLVGWTVLYASGMNVYDAAIGSLVIGILIEVLQKHFKSGTPSYLDIIYTFLGGAIPTIAVVVRGFNG